MSLFDKNRCYNRPILPLEMADSMPKLVDSMPKSADSMSKSVDSMEESACGYEPLEIGPIGHRLFLGSCFSVADNVAGRAPHFFPFFLFSFFG